MKPACTESNRWLWFPLAALFGVIVWQAAMLPLTAAEATAWDQFVRPRFGSLLVTPGAWSGLCYAVLAKRTVGLFRLSEFSLRLPDVLAGGLFLVLLARLASVWKTGRRTGWLLPLAIIPVFMHCFSFAGGLGIALGCCALAIAYSRFGGLWLGLAFAAAPQFWFIWGIVAGAFLLAWGLWRGMEEVVIPSVVIPFIVLLIPLCHGGQALPSAIQASSTDFAVRSAVEILRGQTGSNPVRIAANISAQVPLAFYRERYRRRDWAMDRRDPEYFLWVGAVPPAIFGTRTILLEQDGVVLAH